MYTDLLIPTQPCWAMYGTTACPRPGRRLACRTACPRSCSTSALNKLASAPGAQSGVSRELFDQWADNPRNGLIIADFAVAGTMVRQVLDSPPEVLTRAGLKVQASCDTYCHAVT
jgi:hypothetical protein